MRLYDHQGKVIADTPMRVHAEKTPEIPFVSTLFNDVFDSHSPTSIQPQAITLGQDSNCAILRKHLSTLGVDVETGTELLTYDQNGAGVVATVKIGDREETINAKFLLGADGAKGKSLTHTPSFDVSDHCRVQ